MHIPAPRNKAGSSGPSRNFTVRKLKARSTLRLSEAQKLVCFIVMELCAAHDMCPVQPRTAEKKIYALFNSSQPDATATCCDREFSIFQVQV